MSLVETIVFWMAVTFALGIALPLATATARRVSATLRCNH